MTALIQIHYTSTANNKSYRKAEVPLKGRKPEKAAYEFWKWIKSQHQIGVTIEQVLCEHEDITEVVLELEKQEKLSKDLPF